MDPKAKEIMYRFDFHITTDEPISYKPNVDQLPEFDIDFNNT